MTDHVTVPVRVQLRGLWRVRIAGRLLWAARLRSVRRLANRIVAPGVHVEMSVNGGPWRRTGTINIDLLRV